MAGMIVALGGTVVLVAFFFWLPGYLGRHPPRRPRANSPTAGLMASVEEVWHPDASDAQLIRDAQQRWVEPAPVPDDDRGIADAVIRIDLR
jgi:hypothetical protein